MLLCFCTPQAYRLLAEEMYKKGWDYPLHLGVTEAGEGEDGRMKSAIGIGALLMDGLGDTIRVSLTEDPEYEIDPCKRLANIGQTAWTQVRSRALRGVHERRMGGGSAPGSGCSDCAEPQAAPGSRPHPTSATHGLFAAAANPADPSGHPALPPRIPRRAGACPSLRS
jgi:hypothetical protein